MKFVFENSKMSIIITVSNVPRVNLMQIKCVNPIFGLGQILFDFKYWFFYQSYFRIYLILSHLSFFIFTQRNRFESVDFPNNIPEHNIQLTHEMVIIENSRTSPFSIEGFEIFLSINRH